ncbi:SOS response-associated peptidase, partial [Mycolicibacter minnesotensis]|uniref:SOS response-associated peptidase n=2 Tax=Mycobacteriaceae TaxID=1762 RepID=UPI0021F31270
MCGRFAVTTDPALLAEKIQAIDESVASTSAQKEQKETSSANYNVAPTTTISSVVKRHSEPDDAATRRVRSMRWGLVPPWAKTAEDGGPDTKGPLLINARAEKVTTSPAFRNSAKNKRCLVPMDGWYEWRPNGETASGKKAPKTPFYMYGADGEPLFMAGLWSTWRPKDAPKDAPP